MAKLINYTIFTFFIITFFSGPVFAQSIASGMPALNIIDWHRSTLMSRKKK